MKVDARTGLVATSTLLLLLAAAATAAPRKHTGPSPVPVVQVQLVPSGPPLSPTGGVGTLTYDNNTPFARRGTDGGTVGNLFNAGVQDPHSIASASFRIAGNYGTAPNGGDQMVMTIWDQNPGSFMVLRRTVLTGLPYLPFGGSGNLTMFTAMAPLTMPVVAHSGAFVGGLRNTDYDPCAGSVALNSTCDGVALTMGGVDPGMGFHGIRVPFNSAAFVPTMVVTVPGAGTVITNQNSIFRVTGDNLPVELMSFEAE